jgi:hypothetical protein
MDILEAVDLIKDYSLFEEQEWEVEKIFKRIKDAVYTDKLCFSKDVLIEDMEFLIISGRTKFSLIQYLFKNEPEKLDQLTEAINIIKEYKDSILVARKLNQ